MYEVFGTEPGSETGLCEFGVGRPREGCACSVSTWYEVGSFLGREQVRAQQAFPTARLQTALAAHALGPLSFSSLGSPEKVGPGEG